MGNSKLALIGSMYFEVEIFENQLKNKTIHNIREIRFVTGDILGQPVVLVCTGGGKVNAAITTTLLIEHFNPDCIIFTGVAGAINESLRIGDVVIGERTFYHDFGEVSSNKFIAWRSWEAGSGKSSTQFYPADNKLFLLVEKSLKKRLTNISDIEVETFPRIFKGAIATGDIFCSSLEKKIELKINFNADVVEMDGAAIAQVCWHYKIGCLIIRGISDLTGDNANEEYEINSNLAIKNAARITFKVISEYKLENFNKSIYSSRS